jgi:hypothetical protein
VISSQSILKHTIQKSSQKIVSERVKFSVPSHTKIVVEESVHADEESSTTSSKQTRLRFKESEEHDLLDEIIRVQPFAAFHDAIQQAWLT